MGALQKMLFASDNQEQLKQDYVAIAKKFHALVEKNFEHHDGKFAAGN